MSLENTGLGDKVTFAAETCPRPPLRGLPVFLPAPIWRDAGQKGEVGAGGVTEALLPLSLPGGPEPSCCFSDPCGRKSLPENPTPSQFPRVQRPVVHTLPPCAPHLSPSPAPSSWGS